MNLSRHSKPRWLVLTGAGISAESGIPTFRGPGGYWRNLDPAKLATETAFKADPALVWQWYRERRQQIRAAKPNAAHDAVVKLAAHAGDFLLLTQNVDDLHLRAVWGDSHLEPAQMVQIHGDIFVTQCLRCDYSRSASREDEAGVPVCPRCGRWLRPGVVWFDEELASAQVARVETFLSRGSCDAVLVVGTTATFDYIVQWADQARGITGRMIEVNPQASALSPRATQSIRRPAAEALPELVDRLIAGF